MTVAFVRWSQVFSFVDVVLMILVSAPGLKLPWKEIIDSLASKSSMAKFHSFYLFAELFDLLLGQLSLHSFGDCLVVGNSKAQLFSQLRDFLEVSSVGSHCCRGRRESRNRCGGVGKLGERACRATVSASQKFLSRTNELLSEQTDSFTFSDALLSFLGFEDAFPVVGNVRSIVTVLEIIVERIERRLVESRERIGEQLLDGLLLLEFIVFGEGWQKVREG